ncbi:hypothetical protein [Halorussus salinus]|nr:hypothetical protein [Halorussus salinus]
MTNPTTPSSDGITWFQILVIVETVLGVLWLLFKIWTDVFAPIA